MALVVVQGSVPLPELIGFIKEHGVDVDSASITTDPAASSPSQHKQALLYVNRLDDATLQATAKQLKPGASVAVRVLAGQQDIGSMLLLNGFTDCQPSTSGAVTTVSARLTDFAAGAKDSIKLKPKQQQPAAAAAMAKPSTSAWVLTGDDDGDDELVDDDELLTEADRQRPAPAAQDDCEVGAGGARKACKNCSCGRAEAEARGEKVTLTQEMLDNPQSSCGNCSLGDAFRCAGCPYRGLPAFEAGKKIRLAADFLTADA